MSHPFLGVEQKPGAARNRGPVRIARLEGAINARGLDDLTFLMRDVSAGQQPLWCSPQPPSLCWRSSSHRSQTQRRIAGTGPGGKQPLIPKNVP